MPEEAPMDTTVDQGTSEASYGDSRDSTVPEDSLRGSPCSKPRYLTNIQGVRTICFDSLQWGFGPGTTTPQLGNVEVVL